MSNIHRIVWFDHQVRAKRYPNSTSLSEKFEISNRQALRDIEYLVNTMGAPLTYVPKKRGYEYGENTYIIPYQVITEEEKRILSFLGYRYSQLRYENSSSVNRVAALFDRLAGEKVKDITQTFPFYSVPIQIVQHVYTISHAIQENKKLDISYYSEEQKGIVQNVLEPITLLFNASIDYLVCFHPTDSKEVLIEINRIRELTITREVNHGKSTHTQLHSLEQKPFRAKLEMIESSFIGSSWKGFTIVNREEKIIEVEFYDLDLFVNQFLASNNQVRILGPNWLKDQICEKCQKLIHTIKGTLYADECIENIHVENQSRSYLNSLYAILTASNLFEGPLYMLSGMTGMAFKFTAVEKLAPRSVNSYGGWVKENWSMVNQLGIYNEASADRLRHRTFPLIQKHAIQKMIESLDQGLPVLYWIPEFGVIYGYDLDERIFFYKEAGGYYFSQRPYDVEKKVLLFDNVCKNFSSIWYYQIFGKKVMKDQKEIYSQSLKRAVYDWNTEYKNERAASGKKAYEIIIEALEYQNFDRKGAAYLFRTYEASKLEIYQYLSIIVEDFPFLHAAIQIYKDTHEIFLTILEAYNQSSDGNLATVINLLREAMELEDGAMRLINENMKGVYDDIAQMEWLSGEAR